MIVKCKECRKEISDSAVTCPHCGCDLRWTEAEIAAAEAVNEATGRFFVRFICLLINAIKLIIRLPLSIPWFALGLINLLTIIGAPRAIELFKHGFALAFKASIDIFPETNYESNRLANFIWRITFGWVLVIYQAIAGTLCLLFIPAFMFTFETGLTMYSFIKVAFTPFGAKLNLGTSYFDSTMESIK